MQVSSGTAGGARRVAFLLLSLKKLDVPSSNLRKFPRLPLFFFVCFSPPSYVGEQPAAVRLSFPKQPPVSSSLVEDYLNSWESFLCQRFYAFIWRIGLYLVISATLKGTCLKINYFGWTCLIVYGAFCSFWRVLWKSYEGISSPRLFFERPSVWLRLKNECLVWEGPKRIAAVLQFVKVQNGSCEFLYLGSERVIGIL